jgi:hypothetical protein
MVILFLLGGKLRDSILFSLEIIILFLLLNLAPGLYAKDKFYVYIGGEAKNYSYFLNDIEKLSAQAVYYSIILDTVSETIDITEACIQQQTIIDDLQKKRFFSAYVGQIGIGYTFKPYLAGELNYWTSLKTSTKTFIAEVEKTVFIQCIDLLLKISTSLPYRLKPYGKGGIGLCYEIKNFSDPTIKWETEWENEWRFCFLGGIGLQLQVSSYCNIDASWTAMITPSHHYNSFNMGIHLTY